MFGLAGDGRVMENEYHINPRMQVAFIAGYTEQAFPDENDYDGRQS